MVGTDVLRFRTMLRTLFASALVAAAMAPGVAGDLYAQAPPAEPIFVEASVDNTRPYLGQQIIYVFKVYLRSDLSISAYQLNQTLYEWPDFSGFWTYRAPEPYEYTDTVDSSDYRVIEIQTALFPSVVGATEIGASTLTIPSMSQGTPNILEGAPIAIEVRPLPPRSPDGFVGAVGNFEILAEVDAEGGKVNEPVQLTVRVSGEGNIERLPAPAWPEFTDWRVVELPAAADTQVVDGRITGSRTYGLAMVPTKAGQLTIPRIAYTHFEPSLEEYIQVSTKPIVVSVSRADGLYSETVDVDAAVEADDPKARYVKAVPSSFRQPGAELTDSVIYWAAWGIPALVIAGAAVWRRRRDAEEAALLTSRRRNALPNARASLASAAASGDDPRAAAADAIHSYLADRLDTPLAGLTREALVRHLQDAGIPPDLARLVNEALADGEAARYTPLPSSTGGRTDQVERAHQLLTDLDGAMAT